MCRLDFDKLCRSSRADSEWEVAEGALAALTTASLGDEKICRRLLRVGLDELIDAAEDTAGQSNSRRSTPLPASGAAKRPASASLRAVAPGTRGKQDAPTAARGPMADVQLDLDQIDQIGVDGVLREGAEALSRSMKGQARDNCSALATSLLQSLGPFNYVSPGCRELFFSPVDSLQGRCTLGTGTNFLILPPVSCSSLDPPS